MENADLIDQIISSAVPRIRKVRVCSRGDLVADHESVVERLNVLVMTAKNERSLGGSPEIGELRDRLIQLEDELDSASTEVIVKALSRNAWADLLGEYPPTPEQAKTGADVDDSLFQAASVAACVGIPEAKAKALADTLPTGEWMKLWAAVLDLNVKPNSVPKLGAATAHLRVSERSSTTSDPGASLAGPSSENGSGTSPSSSTATTDD